MCVGDVCEYMDDVCEYMDDVCCPIGQIRTWGQHTHNLLTQMISGSAVEWAHGGGCKHDIHFSTRQACVTKYVMAQDRVDCEHC